MKWSKHTKRYSLPTCICNIHVRSLGLTLICVIVYLQALRKHAASRHFLETKMAELEKVREANKQDVDEKSDNYMYVH